MPVHRIVFSGKYLVLGPGDVHLGAGQPLDAIEPVPARRSAREGRRGGGGVLTAVKRVRAACAAITAVGRPEVWITLRGRWRTPRVWTRAPRPAVGCR